MHYHEPGDFDFAKILAQAAPSQAKAFGAFDAKVFDPADEVLDLRTRELIAIAVAATTQCPYCMDVHVGNAKKAGASREEVARAVFVASGLRAGGAYTHGFLAFKAFEEGADLEHFHEPGDRKHLRSLRQAAGGAVEAFGAFDAAVFDPEDEVLSVLTRELIAIAVAATTQCPYCLAGHVGKAKAAGAGEEHIARAVMVAAALRAGAAYTHGFLAMKLYDEK
ncbi:carboxymuconolactone decarboxylase family protein [Brevibacterium album]|uniref:carboxymuconolactone decarboxylase family protein n=1 Tax=Brevibacterium album TaxID=417948 RepID=UPI0004179E48|nr:carboxymuconolactone decarboxylase family protein [Brevibacterium album]